MQYMLARIQGGGNWEISLTKITFFSAKDTEKDELYDKY